MVIFGNNNLINRTITGIVFVGVIVGSIIWNQLVFALLFFLITIFTLAEFYDIISRDKKIKPQKITGVFFGAILYTLAALAANNLIDAEILVFALFLPFILFITELFRKQENPFTNIGITILGIFYIVLPFSLLNFFFNPDFVPGNTSTHILLGFFIILWMYDMFAYLVGMIFGKRRMFERISPKKSWEGLIGGLLFALTAAWLISMKFVKFDLLNWIIISFIIIIFGTLGDLVESMLKRSYEIKDSGRILPGHGGLLDRFDAVFIAAPAVFVYIVLINSYLS